MTPQCCHAAIESLESRRLLAASATLQPDGTLIVQGTSGNDHLIVDGVIRVSPHHPQADRIYVSDVRITGQSTGDVLLAKDFSLADVKAIVLDGGDGNDGLFVMTTDAIPTTVFGGAGDDGIEAWTGSAGNIVHGGDGRDYISTSSGNDSIYGDAGKDVIHSQGGNDLISGGGGNDVLYGGDGRDRIYGGIGADLMLGQAQADRLHGQTGNDTLDGGGGNDQLDGGAGSDSHVGSYGDDHFTADDGEADTLDGGGGTNAGTFDDPLDLVDGVDAIP